MVNKKSVSKKLIAIILAVVLVIGTLPVGFASVFAAIKNGYVISIKDYDYSANVTLTDKSDAANVAQVEMKNGKAKFDNLDDEKTYQLSITDMYGYENYSADITPTDNSLELQSSDLQAIALVNASGKVIDETGTPVKNLKITYTPVDFADASATVKTDDNGQYSFDVYKDVLYKISMDVDKQYEKVEKNTKLSTNLDLGTQRLTLKQFSISAAVSGGNGTIGGNNTFVDYGKDLGANRIVAKAEENYKIDKLIVDGNEIVDAAGQSEYDLANVPALKNVTDSHSVVVSFYRPTYEITINYNKNGEVKDNSDNPMSNGGKIILQEGDNAGYKATANEGYHIASVVTDGVSETGTFDNSKTNHSAVFSDNKAHSVTITFAVNTYKVTVANTQNGTVEVEPGTVDYKGNSVVTIKPNDGYDVDTFSISSDSSVDASSLSELDNTYTYTISEITENITVNVTFKEIETASTSDDLYTLTFSKEPVVKGNKYIVGKNESVTITPVSPYVRVRVNGTDRGTSKTYTYTKNINKIEVSTKSIGFGWDKSYSPNMQFVVDTTAPTIGNITKSPNQDYYNNAYNVSFKVTDGDAGVKSH